jgi:hypothetical protein
MAADRLPAQTKHSRDAKLWAVVIIGAALLVLAADLMAQISGAPPPRIGPEKLGKYR